MAGSTILIVFVFLLVVAVFAGIGIGLVIGLVLWGREEGISPAEVQHPPVPPVSSELPSVAAGSAVQSESFQATVASVVPVAVEGEGLSQQDDAATSIPAVPAESRSLAEISAAAVSPQPAAAPRRGQSWSVALAIGVIVICCVCTFLLAALTTISR